MNPAGGFASGLVGEDVDECGKVVVGHGLSFSYLRRAGAIGVTNGRRDPWWSSSKVFPRFQSESLHLFPGAELSLLGPHRGHLG